MGIADDARRMLDQRDELERAQREVSRQRQDEVTTELRRIIAPLAPQFALAAGGKWNSPSRWAFQVAYDYGTSGDGYGWTARAAVIVHDDGTFDVWLTGEPPSGKVLEESVRASMTRALAEVLDKRDRKRR